MIYLIFGGKFIKDGQAQDKIIKEDAMKDVSDIIYDVLLAIAICVALIWGAFLGIQLMMQGAEGKAQIKEALIPYVIGCTIAFAAFGIWKVIVTALQGTGL